MIPVAFEIIAKKDNYTGSLDAYDPACEQRQIYVARSSAGLGQLAIKVTRIKRALDGVDFDKDFILFLTSGTQPSTGCDVEIREVRYSPNKNNLELVIEEVSAKGMDSPTLVFPFRIISLPLKYYPKTVECITPEGKLWPAEIKIE